MSKLILFTWNLGGSEKAFRSAFDHLLKKGNPFIVAFQELPESIQTTDDANSALKNLGHIRVICHSIVPRSRKIKKLGARIGLFTSADIFAKGAITISPANRTVGVCFQSINWKTDLAVVVVHAVDRRNISEDCSRGIAATLIREHAEAHWIDNRSLILLGDFNADPFDLELTSRSQLLAIRDSTQTKMKIQSGILGRKVRPLYNPMWCLLPEKRSGPGGSYWLISEERLSWRLIDQIIVSNDLISKINKPKVLAKLSGSSRVISLLAANGQPDKAAMSDHLPVLLMLDI